MPFAGIPCCSRSWRRAFSGSIPGIGVPPGLITTLAFLGSGIPGVGVVPRGTFALPGAGIPGVELPDGVTGLAESPGGRLAALTFCIVALFAFALAEFVSAPPPQAAPSIADAAAVISNFFIGMIPSSI